jgi:hypothetical protein
MAQEKELKPHEHTAHTLASKFAKALLKLPPKERKPGKRNKEQQRTHHK